MPRFPEMNETGTIVGRVAPGGLILIGWACAAAGIAVLGFSRTLVMRFMTDHLGVSALVAGSLFAFSKLFDALSDPVMGVLSDRTETRWGRRLPYLLAGALLCAAAYPLLFGAPVSAPDHAALHMGIALAFYALAYTVFHVPYLAMAVEIAPGYDDRSRLMSARAVGIAAGSLAAGVGGPLAIVAFGGGVAGHRAMSWLLALLTFGLLLVGFAALSRAPRVEPLRSERRERPRVPPSRRERDPYRRLLVAKALFVVGLSVLTTLSAYVVTHVLEAPDTRLAVFFGAFFVGVIISQPLWLRVAKRYDKRRAYIVACLALAAINLSWLTAGPAEATAVFVVRSAVVGMTMGGAMTTGLAMLPDTFELDARRGGRHREGLLAGFYTTVEKGGAALGIAVVAVALRLIGYAESGAEEAIVQDAGTVRWLRVLFAVLPALALAASAWVMRRYALDADALEALAKETTRVPRDGRDGRAIDTAT